MSPTAPRRVRVGAAAWALACALAGIGGLREAGARLELRATGDASSIPALAGDADLACDRAAAALDAGDLAGARDAAAVAIAGRPRDPYALLLASAAEPGTTEALRLAWTAARAAPYDVAPARRALRIAIDVATTAGARSAAVAESARRLRAAGVTDGTDELDAEARRLRYDLVAALDTALAAWRATSPTARGRRFVEDDAARAAELLRDAESVR